MTRASGLQCVEELLPLYDAEDACAAALLSDQHDPCALAHRIIALYLSTQDLSYGELRHDSEKFAAPCDRFAFGPGDRVATLMGSLTGSDARAVVARTLASALEGGRALWLPISNWPSGCGGVPTSARATRARGSDEPRLQNMSQQLTDGGLPPAEAQAILAYPISVSPQGDRR